MTAIGGFFGLELPLAGEPYHLPAQSLALSSGRACLRRILECLRPSRVWVPFYICDVALASIAHSGASVEFYAVDTALDPVLPAGQPSAGDVVVYVNYFGLKASGASAFAASLGRRAVIDDTQAFFQRGYSGSCSFNSARKFFGVPDGGYAYGDGLAATQAPASSAIRYDHLITWWLGDRERAFEQYRANEACIADEPAAMSAFTRRVLAGVDYVGARRAREENFARLHEKLGSKNRLAIFGDEAVGPFCYPLLVEKPVPWDVLWRRGMFVPRLWADVEKRAGNDMFRWECQLASQLLPLPVDQRYDAGDMNRLSAAVAEVMAW